MSETPGEMLIRYTIPLALLLLTGACSSPPDDGSSTDAAMDTGVVDTSGAEETGVDGTGDADVGRETGGSDTTDADTTKARITTDAAKVDCGRTPCPGTERCYRPGNDDPECERCSIGQNCPDKCIRWCLKRCFVDGTCDNPDEKCVDGNAEGARVCLPPEAQ